MAVTMVIGNSRRSAPPSSRRIFASRRDRNEFAEASGDLHTGALAALGLLLFAVTVLLNVAARLLVRMSRRGPARSSMTSLRTRKAINYFMTALCGLALAIALVPLVSLLWLVVSRGCRA